MLNIFFYLNIKLPTFFTNICFVKNKFRSTKQLFHIIFVHIILVSKMLLTLSELSQIKDQVFTKCLFPKILRWISTNFWHNLTSAKLNNKFYKISLLLKYFNSLLTIPKLNHIKDHFFTEKTFDKTLPSRCYL